jgi:hypothetical protein
MDLAWLVIKPLVTEFAAILKEAHAEAWSMFFKSLGFTDAPETVKHNLVVNVDKVWRKEVDLWVPNHIDYRHLNASAQPPIGYNL